MDDAKYFTGFEQDESPPSPSDPKPPDSTHDLLPFTALSDRQFEYLALLLTRKAPGQEGCRVTLMAGSGDAGRDVIVSDESGRLTTIIQCKCYVDRVTLPQVRAELAKLALHHHLEPSILGEGPVDYQVWAAVDFTQPAAKLIDEWPGSWTEDQAKKGFDAVASRYAAFEGLDWDSVAEAMTTGLTNRLTPHKRTQVEISIAVRDDVPTYTTFFEGSVRASVEDLRTVVAETRAGRAATEIEAALDRARRGDLAVGLDRLDRFWAEHRAALSDADKFQLLKARSRLHLLSGETVKATADARAAMRFADDPFESKLLEAQVLLYEGQKSQALETAEAVIELNPSTPRAWLVRVESDESDAPTGELIDRIPPLTLADGEVAAAIARRALSRQELDLASEHGRGAVAAMPDWIGAYVAACGALVSSVIARGVPVAPAVAGELHEVVALSTKGLELPTPPSAGELKAALFVRRGQARELLGQASGNRSGPRLSSSAPRATRSA